MSRLLRRVVATSALVATSLSVAVFAEARMVIDDSFFVQPTFEMQGSALGPAQKWKGEAPASLAGSTIAAVDGGALVIDNDSGDLIRTNKGGDVVARLAIGAGASQLVFDAAASRAYVTNRQTDEVVVVDVGKKKLVERKRWTTPTEPWGVALSPDASTLLVTTIADRTLVALDASTGKQAWETGLAREPRGVAISPDGKRAMVAYLSTGTVERIDLTATEHWGVHVSLLGATNANRGFQQQAVTGFVAEAVPLRSFARSAFAVRFIGNELAIVAHQESTPVQISDGFSENVGSYGGGFDSPINHRIAFIGAPDGAITPTVSAKIVTHQPDALAWDPEADALVVAGYGSDDLVVVKDASQASVALDKQIMLGGEGSCGPDGVAIANGHALVWCSLSRRVLDVALDTGAVAFGTASVTTSTRTELEQQGLALFRGGNDARISANGAMACASCHPDGRADGLSWRIDGHVLQTPVLDGRIAGTHPYKWDGGDPDLTASLGSTMKRLGGFGIGEPEIKALSAYLETLPSPRVPARDRKQVKRGKKLFDSAELGCRGCHEGADYTDQTKHSMTSATLQEIDTPSLIGLASSAPYYHDGSAVTLDALLRDAALVHGMADLEDLDDQQITDLAAYLETL